jgi:hypothetical protein
MSQTEGYTIVPIREDSQGIINQIKNIFNRQQLGHIRIDNNVIHITIQDHKYRWYQIVSYDSYFYADTPSASTFNNQWMIIHENLITHEEKIHFCCTDTKHLLGLFGEILPVNYIEFVYGHELH